MQISIQDNTKGEFANSLTKLILLSPSLQNSCNENGRCSAPYFHRAEPAFDSRINTPMSKRLVKQPMMSETRGNAMRRWGKPQEVGEAVVWLCSEAASFVTGHAMAVDAGFLAA